MTMFVYWNEGFVYLFTCLLCLPFPEKGCFNKRLLRCSEKLSVENKIRVFDHKYTGALRLAELGKDELDLRRPKRAAAQVAETTTSCMGFGPISL
jgi:hypothetical protein